VEEYFKGFLRIS